MTEQTVDFLTGRRSILHLNSKNEKIAVCLCLVSSLVSVGLTVGLAELERSSAASV